MNGEIVPKDDPRAAQESICVIRLIVKLDHKTTSLKFGEFEFTFGIPQGNDFVVEGVLAYVAAEDFYHYGKLHAVAH